MLFPVSHLHFVSEFLRATVSLGSPSAPRRGTLTHLLLAWSPDPPCGFSCSHLFAAAHMQHHGLMLLTSVPQLGQLSVS